MSVTRKDIVRLLGIGVAIVLASYIGGWYFGTKSWTWWNIANVFHMAGGAYAFFLARAIFLYTKGTHRFSATATTELFIFILGALAIGMLWEWYEFIVDRYNVFILGNTSFMTYADTIGDLMLDTLGAVGAACFVFVYGKRR